MHVKHAPAPVHQPPPLDAPVCLAAAAGGLAHDMHGPNRLNDARSASSRAPAQVAAVGHESILRETSSASSLQDERRRKPKQK